MVVVLTVVLVVVVGVTCTNRSWRLLFKTLQYLQPVALWQGGEFFPQLWFIKKLLENLLVKIFCLF